MLLEPWQERIIQALFAVDEAGEWAAVEVGALVARQSGKGEILVLYTLAHLFLFPRPDGRRKTILYTAHETKTAADGMQRIRGVIEANPALAKRVRRIMTANGQESIEIQPHSPKQPLPDRVRFIARSKNSGRGFTADVIVADEAQELGQVAHSALLYTQGAVENKQRIYFGTVPDPASNDCEVFEGLRDRGRAGLMRRGAWIEWSPEGSEVPGYVPDYEDVNVWSQANPSLGVRPTLETVEGELEASRSDLEAFGRERLSVWPNPLPAGEVVVNELDFETFGPGDPGADLFGPVVISISLGEGMSYGTISGACRDGEHIFVRTLATETSWLRIADRLWEFYEQFNKPMVVLDAKNCAPIISDLDRLGIKRMEVNPTELAGAFALLVESFNAGLISHRGQTDLIESFRHAEPRSVGRYGNTWTQSNPREPVTQAQSVTLAHWGVKKSESRPRRAGKVRGYGG